VVGRLLRSRLYELDAVDPLSLLLPTGVLLLCALVASALPARRAASIEPLEALRTE
jgi:ABC-type lipoprotein release transport system permease subunit